MVRSFARGGGHHAWRVEHGRRASLQPAAFALFTAVTASGLLSGVALGAEPPAKQGTTTAPALGAPEDAPSEATPPSADTPKETSEFPDTDSASSAPEQSPDAPPNTAASESGASAEVQEGLSSPEEEPMRSAKPTEAPAEATTPGQPAPEDQDGWFSWPFSQAEADDPAAPPHRWASLGGFVGVVSRPSRETHIQYGAGLAWGGYLRPEITSWLGVRLYYREERLPVTVTPGAFNYGEDTFGDDFTQPDLEVISLGGNFEPTWVIHPRFRAHGILGWGWVGFRAPIPEGDGLDITKTYRTGAQMDFTFGAGLAVDIIKNWLELRADVSHNLAAARTGSAYEPLQVIIDGEIKHMAPLPRLQNSTDAIFSLGVIF